MIPIGGGRGGINKPSHPLVPGGQQHIQESVNVALVGKDRVLDGSRDAAQGGLVQHHVCPGTEAPADLQVPDIGVMKAKPGPLQRRHQGLDIFQIFPFAGGEIIQSDHFLVPFQQLLQEGRTDETGHPGDEPSSGVGSVYLVYIVCLVHLVCFVGLVRLTGSFTAEAKETQRKTFTTETRRAQRMIFFLKSGDTDFRKPFYACGGQE